MAFPWVWKNFRNTFAGGFADVDLNDANNVSDYWSKNAVYGGTDGGIGSETQCVDRLGQKFGNPNAGTSAWTGSNSSSGAAGTDFQCGGCANMSSANQRRGWFMNPGTKNFVHANGSPVTSSVTGAEAWFDGLLSGFTSAFGFSSWRLWSASRAATSGWVFVSMIDGSAWRAPSGYTTGSTEPSVAGSVGGAGLVFVDNSVNLARVVDAAGNPCSALTFSTGTPSGTSQIFDQNSNRAPGHTVNTYGASNFRKGTGTGINNPVVGVVTGRYGNGICSIKCDDNTMVPRTIGVQRQAETLQDVSVFDIFGTAVPSGGTIYANEIVGLPILRIATVNGEYTTAAFTLGGALASYFSIAFYQDAIWLMQAVRIPDALAGSRTLTITQDSPGDTGTSGSTRTTNFSFNVASSQGKPTVNYGLGRMPTRQWLVRKTAKDVVDARWAGYTGQSFVSDQLVTSGTDFRTKIAALSPDGTSWYRLRLDSGTYTGYHTASIRKNFGTGGLLIEPASGATVDWRMGWSNYAIHGLHIRGFTVVPRWVDITDANNMFRFQDPGSGLGYWSKVKFSNCNIGMMYGGYDANAVKNDCTSNIFLMEQGLSLEVSDCNFNGNQNHHTVSGVYCYYRSNNDYRNWGILDIEASNNAARYNSTQGVLPSNNCHSFVEYEVVRNKLKLSTIFHPDYKQKRTTLPILRWTPNTDWSATDYVVGAQFVNMVNSKVYQIATRTAPYNSGPNPGPSGTGTGISWGADFTCDYVADYTVASTSYDVVENVVCNCDGLGGADSSADGVNFAIDSNLNRNSPVYSSWWNVQQGNPLKRGIGMGDGEVWIGRCTLVPPNRLRGDLIVTTDEAQMPCVNRVSSNATVFDFENVYAGDVNGNSGLFASFGSQKVSFLPAATSPATVMRGTFTNDQGKNAAWGYPSLVDDGSGTGVQFAQAASKILHLNTGAAGARQTEVHQLTAFGATMSVTVTP